MTGNEVEMTVEKLMRKNSRFKYEEEDYIKTNNTYGVLVRSTRQ